MKRCEFELIRGLLPLSRETKKRLTGPFPFYSCLFLGILSSHVVIVFNTPYLLLSPFQGLSGLALRLASSLLLLMT